MPIPMKAIVKLIDVIMSDSVKTYSINKFEKTCNQHFFGLMVGILIVKTSDSPDRELTRNMVRTEAPSRKKGRHRRQVHSKRCGGGLRSTKTTQF